MTRSFEYFNPVRRSNAGRRHWSHVRRGAGRECSRKLAVIQCGSAALAACWQFHHPQLLQLFLVPSLSSSSHEHITPIFTMSSSLAMRRLGAARLPRLLRSPSTLRTLTYSPVTRRSLPASSKPLYVCPNIPQWQPGLTDTDYHTSHPRAHSASLSAVMVRTPMRCLPDRH